MCKTCNGNVKFFQSDKRGAGFKLVMRCNNCEEKTVDSCPKIERAYEVNRRLVFVFRLLGVEYGGIKKFCGLMDICAGLAKNTYYACLEKINNAATAVYDTVLEIAVNEEKESNAMHGKEAENLTVSGDGTWKKRGFTSLFGVSTLIGSYSGKVVDAMVKSSF